MALNFHLVSENIPSESAPGEMHFAFAKTVFAHADWQLHLICISIFVGSFCFHSTAESEIGFSEPERALFGFLPRQWETLATLSYLHWVAYVQVPVS